MIQRFTSDELVTNVKRDAFIAVSDDNWYSERILGIADDVIADAIAPRLKTTKQNWFYSRASITLAANTTSYDIPEEAMWNGVDSIHLCQISDSSIVAKLDLYSPQSAELYQPQGSAIPGYYFTENTRIRLNCPPDSSSVQNYYLDVGFYRRPGKLVSVASITTIQSVTAASLLVTTNTQPAWFLANAVDPYTTGTPLRVDVYAHATPYSRRLNNATCTSGTTNLTFNGTVTTANVATLSSGDIVTVHGTTVFPDLPGEMMPVLRRFTAAQIMLAQKDKTYDAYMQRLNVDFEQILRGMGNRADGTPKKLSLYHSGAARMIQWRTYRRN